MNYQDKGKLIVSIAKSLKNYQMGDPSIATYLYAAWDAGRLGLFVSSIKSEKRSSIRRIQFLAAQEGITPPVLGTEILPWLESAGLCQLTRDSDGDIAEVTSSVLAYRDLLEAVAHFYETRTQSDEDRATLLVFEQASELPRPESAIRHTVAQSFSEPTAGVALSLARSYKIVEESSTNDSEKILYAPRVWAGLHSKAPRALSALNNTDREVLLHLVNQVRNNQGYPEGLLRSEAERNGASYLVDLALGVALVNGTELNMADGTSRTFLTTPHFYSDLADEFGEDMCDRVKIFLDSIRNGQYFAHSSTGRIFDPELLLRALLDRGVVGPATAIGTDYIVAEKAGIIRVQRESAYARPLMELRQEDTVRKVLQVVSSGSLEPGAPKLGVNHLTGGNHFKSIEQGRAEFGEVTRELAELRDEVIRNLREA